MEDCRESHATHPSWSLRASWKCPDEGNGRHNLFFREDPSQGLRVTLGSEGPCGM